MQVSLLDLKRQYKQIEKEVLEETKKIFEDQSFILGKNVLELEEKIAEYCQSKYSVGVSSGTDALLLCLMAENIQSGDIVITTPYTFFATAGAIARVGAVPVFADIKPDTYNIDPDKIQKAISSLSSARQKKVKAIIPVHLYGQCADMKPILEIAKKYNLVVIEDSAQAIGSEYKKKRAGSIGDYGCFSFFPSKNLGAFGDGGIITVNSKSKYEKLLKLRVHGAAPKYYHKLIGGNFRLDSLQAKIVFIKLKYLDEWTRKRQENAKLYKDLFKKYELEKFITPPYENKTKATRHIYNQFVIKVHNKKRDGLLEFLKQSQIGSEIYYPVPLHLQECFLYLNYKKQDFPFSEDSANSTLALPIYPELKKEEIEFVVSKIKEFFSK